VRRVPIHRLKPTGVPFVIAAVVVAADAATKAWARSALHRPRQLYGPFSLHLTYNTGTSFSLGQHSPGVVSVAVLVALGVVVALAPFARRGAPRWGFGLIVGGGVGNVIDRYSASPHEVTDFIKVGSFPIFNLADSAVTVGIIILFTVALRQRTLVEWR